MFGAHACNIENETSQMEQDEEGGRALWEFQFLHSMALRDHDVINDGFGGFDLMRELSFKPFRPLRMALVLQ